MTSIPDISIIINNYNYAAFLPRAIDSALAQTGVRAEVIVVDDGSSDDSARVIEGYGTAIRPVLKPNGGQASAINAGVAVARAPILAFLDADDWLMPGKSAAVLAAFAAEPRAVLVYHRLQPTFSDGRRAFRAIPPSLCSGDLAPRLARSGGRWPFPLTSALAVRRSAWDEAGEIPAQFRISADAWLTGILPFLGPVVALPEALAVYRIHNNTWFRQQDDKPMLRRRLAHWEDSVAVTNAFLAARGRPERVSVADHFDHGLAAARLALPGAPGRGALLWRGLLDAGEPKLVRRILQTLRGLAAVRRDTSAPAVAVEAR